MFIILKHCFIWEISFHPASIYSILYTHWNPLYSDFWKLENNNILISHNKLSVGQNEEWVIGVQRRLWLLSYIASMHISGICNTIADSVQEEV
jgi:hypothetical protein